MSRGRNRTQQNFWNSNAQQANQQITQVDPLEQAYRDRQKAFLDWEGSNGKDVRNAPGMDAHIQIGQAALERAGRDRMGTGALQLGEDGGSGYAAKLKELKKNELGQEVGAGLETALAARTAEAHGSVMPLAQLTTSRNIGRANHSAQMFGMWNQRQSKNWWDYMRDAVGMGSQAAGAFGI